MDDQFVPEWFVALKTISYWQSQLRGNNLKHFNSNSVRTTKSIYLYQLWIFNKWLSKKDFTVNTLQGNSQNTFVQKTENRQFENVEQLFMILEQPFADQKNVTRIIKQYFLDDAYDGKKASYLIVIKSMIGSYFEKSSSLLHFCHIIYSPTMHEDQEQMLLFLQVLHQFFHQLR